MNKYLVKENSANLMAFANYGVINFFGVSSHLLVNGLQKVLESTINTHTHVPESWISSDDFHQSIMSVISTNRNEHYETMQMLLERM